MFFIIFVIFISFTLETLISEITSDKQPINTKTVCFRKVQIQLQGSLYSLIPI